jgi:hypothetical protein
MIHAIITLLVSRRRALRTPGGIAFILPRFLRVTFCVVGRAPRVGDIVSVIIDKIFKPLITACRRWHRAQAKGIRELNRRILVQFVHIVAVDVRQRVALHPPSDLGLDVS